ncbi:MAG: hypothetical protein A2782_00595 [Candidatus Blackburnbacteria bacterium RIFCSPHIGHO2_01_FULL_43_15b]|uniref:Uncharacterized protein n=1 Tax=Candidatus Blackburnbacteria bacterium RIFCSPHIGHO2_01_FULL_43_15b TaxID=1797513 RepID=A0A1G1UYP2_9BACT|nr:MAG: hypothetical protein A2782_00595 [Candidatus Blackburnbacteria bacterium RIFCSPHIGHO2_01_FULL_43_15b]
MNGTDGALRAPNRTLGRAKRKGVGGGRNFSPPSLSAAAEFYASETGAPPFLSNLSDYQTKSKSYFFF